MGTNIGTFEWALAQARWGKRIYRDGWISGGYLVVIDGRLCWGSPGSSPTLIKCAYIELADLMADDWEAWLLPT